jgi:mannan endo-1,4-beta-mannosidase
MRAALQVGLGSLALTSALPGHGRKSRGLAEDDFIFVKDLRLYDSEGLHYLTGNSTLPSKQKDKN